MSIVFTVTVVAALFFVIGLAEPVAGRLRLPYSEILAVLGTLICWRNAAWAPIRDHTGFLRGPWGVDRMLEDCPVSAIDPRLSRETFDTPDNLPTLNDAEVQVVTPILPDLIVDVTVATDKSELEAWMAANDRVRLVEVYPDIFTAH